MSFESHLRPWIDPEEAVEVASNEWIFSDLEDFECFADYESYLREYVEVVRG